MKKSSLMRSVTLAAASVALLTSTEAMAKKSPMEKCYGVVKADKNDCSSVKNKHSCAGGAKSDGNSAEWVYVPNGLCDKLVNGSKKES